MVLMLICYQDVQDIFSYWWRGCVKKQHHKAKMRQLTFEDLKYMPRIYEVTCFSLFDVFLFLTLPSRYYAGYLKGSKVRDTTSWQKAWLVAEQLVSMLRKGTCIPASGSVYRGPHGRVWFRRVCLCGTQIPGVSLITSFSSQAPICITSKLNDF